MAVDADRNDTCDDVHVDVPALTATSLVVELVPSLPHHPSDLPRNHGEHQTYHSEIISYTYVDRGAESGEEEQITIIGSTGHGAL